ncbi:pseudouridine synthase [uncultured Roseobacter sp.]|uniref:pseudouridine synthase n=1 Tax=uncultured Roseobacter sp. TaxID=114847 RepID=UPI00260D78C0|nr:pseudouridine synthase [uncultured Roseobacter sp.]
MSTDDTPAGDRIAKVLSRAGVASRREAERMIEAGRVTVNGEKITSPALNVTAADKITVDGKDVGEPDPPRIWLYHKPTGLVSTDNDEKGRDTIYDKLPADMPRVMSIGRLDLNSEGLLLLTNDGGVKRRLELPSTGWLRRYRVRVNGRPTDETFEPLRRGISADGENFQPMTVSLDRQQGANAWLTVGLREGRNREIRRAMTEIGLSVNRLIRISYGPFQLGDLKQGEVEEVRRKIVRDQLGLEAAPEKPAPRTPQRGKGAGRPQVRRGPRRKGGPGDRKRPG